MLSCQRGQLAQFLLYVATKARYLNRFGQLGGFHAMGVCRYVSGDFRFRNGYCRSNPRKMVTMWAEKEFRNLNRLEAAGIRCPKPVFLRQHVLVMEFIGADGVAAPRLKVCCSMPSLPLRELAVTSYNTGI